MELRVYPKAIARPTRTGGGLETASIDDILAYLPEDPARSSRDLGWSGLTLDIFRAAPKCQLQLPAHDHHLVCYCLSGSARMVQARGGRVHHGSISQGMSVILPAGHDSMWDGAAPASVRLRIPTGLLAQAAEQAGRRSISQYELRSVFETQDPTLARIAQVMTAELDRRPHPVQKLFVDSLSCALAAHLLRHFNAYEFPDALSPQPLSARQLSQLTEYIEAGLGAPIGLDELAKVAGISKFHFSRAFKQSMGVPPIQFVEQSRIRRAKELLATRQFTLAEVALRCGFADQSHFTRRFHKHVGCTPRVYTRDRDGLA